MQSLALLLSSTLMLLERGNVSYDANIEFIVSRNYRCSKLVVAQPRRRLLGCPNQSLQAKTMHLLRIERHGLGVSGLFSRTGPRGEQR